MAFGDLVKMMKEKVDTADSGKTKGVNSMFQFDLSGDSGGVFHVNVTDDQTDVIEGAHDSPNATISMTADDFQSMLEGKLNAASAFMAGKLKVKGDLSLAEKLQALVD